MSAWIEVKAILANAPEDWAVWTEIFDRHGYSGTVQTDFPPTLSTYVAPGDEARITDLEAELKAFGALSVEQKLVHEEDWANAWKQYFKPRKVGKNWVIQPTWEDYEAQPGDQILLLDPGQAFGTGDHPTTRGCLELMEPLDFTNKAVADIGCGSGVLSVAAGKLGATDIVGVDIELPAVEASRENAERNHVEMEIFQGLGFTPLPEGKKYDVVLSNIISAALVKLAPEVADRLHENGIWIVSGIIKPNWPDVQTAADQAGFQVKQTVEEDDWVSALLVR